MWQLKNKSRSAGDSRKLGRSVRLYGVSGLLALAILAGGGQTQPVLPGQTPEARQTQAEAAYANKTAEKYADYLVVEGRAYALFNGYSPLTQALYTKELNKFAERLPEGTKLYSLLAPTSAAVTLDEKYADMFPNQQQIIDEVTASLDERFTSINILPTLLAHKNEYLYFRTDHHWTARAGYLAYTDICKAMGLTVEPISSYPLCDSGVSFIGSVGAACGSVQLSMGLDHLYYYRITRPITYTYWNNNGEPFTSQGVYKSWNLRPEQTNKYAFFMGGDLPFIKLTTGANTGRRLAIIKDSYANTVIPFLANHFDEIYVLDPRHSNFNAIKIIEDNKIGEVLFLNYTRVVCLPRFAAQLDDLMERVPVQLKAQSSPK